MISFLCLLVCADSCSDSTDSTTLNLVVSNEMFAPKQNLNHRDTKKTKDVVWLVWCQLYSVIFIFNRLWRTARCYLFWTGSMCTLLFYPQTCGTDEVEIQITSLILKKSQNQKQTAPKKNMLPQKLQHLMLSERLLKMINNCFEVFLAKHQELHFWGETVYSWVNWLICKYAAMET